MPTIHWTANGIAASARWHSEHSAAAPTRVVVVDDRTTAATAHRLARRGIGLLWRGDFHNGRQLLRALDKRLRPRAAAGDDAAALFTAHRAARAERARVLGRLLVVLEPDHRLALRRAPDVRTACLDAYGAPDGPLCVSFAELVGVLGASEWRRRGVPIAALGERVHPRYGVFSPVRGEYVDLVAEAPMPRGAGRTAFDLGTGTGVLAAVLARRGIGRVVATDISPRAVACARENVDRLGVAAQVAVVEADLYPEGRADLVVCNPPWLPAQPSSSLELGIYDPDSQLLRRFLDGLAAHLTPGGEGWLILSDLAEHLGLRTRDDLLGGVDAAGLRVAGRHDTRPRHPRAGDTSDLLHVARGKEVTSLWRLVPTAECQ